MRSLITTSLQIDARAVGLAAIETARADQRSEAKRYSPALRTPYLRLLRMALDYKRKVAANDLYQALAVHRRQQIGTTAARIEDLKTEIDRIDNPSTRPNRYYAVGGTDLLNEDLTRMRGQLARLQGEKEARVMDNATKDTLKALSAFVRHWRQDVGSGLKPTIETLDYAEKMISAALKKEQKK